MADEKEEGEVTREQALRRAYSQATNDLRESHREDFNKFYQQRAKEAGYDWAPKPTPEQKAASQVDELFEQYPELREKYTGKGDSGDEGEQDEQKSA